VRDADTKRRIWPEVTLLSIVRIAPLHDAGITVSSTRTPDTL